MKKKIKPILKKVRPLGNLKDTYYTYSNWDTKLIDGIEFIGVYKINPEEFTKPQNIFWMRKDNLETVK